MDITKRLDMNQLVHLNNFIFLVFAICTERVHESGLLCKDKVGAKEFLYFILYGNLCVYTIVFISQALYACNLLEVFTRKLGAVCITINTFVFIGAVVLFDFLSMVYGIYQYFFLKTSNCKELELFTMCCAYIFLVWIVILLFQGVQMLMNRQNPQRAANYQGML